MINIFGLLDSKAVVNIHPWWTSTKDVLTFAKFYHDGREKPIFVVTDPMIPLIPFNLFCRLFLLVLFL